MAIDRDEVLRVAALARLQLDDEALPRLQQELSRVLDHVRQLEAVDVAGVEPLTHALDRRGPLREDRVVAALGPAALADAPELEDGLVVVPRILESP